MQQYSEFRQHCNSEFRQHSKFSQYSKFRQYSEFRLRFSGIATISMKKGLSSKVWAGLPREQRGSGEKVSNLMSHPLFTSLQFLIAWSI